MKRNLFILSCCIIFGCKKESHDYRNKFIGDYNFVIFKSWGYGGMPITQGDTTYSENGRIENSSDKNTVLLFSSSLSLEAFIYEEGTLEGYQYNGKGEFLSEKEFKYSWSYNSPGGHTTFRITGIKR